MKTVPLESSKYYHFFNKGNNKENIFVEDENYYYFLRLIDKYLIPIIDLYSYCLLPNHFHLVFRIKDEKDLPVDYQMNNKELYRAFSNLFNAYTKAFNKRYNRTGNLLKKHPVKNLIDSERYLRNTILYVNTNPDHHNIGNSLDYDFSSYKQLILGNSSILKQDIIIYLFDDIENFKFAIRSKRMNIEILKDILEKDEKTC